MHVAVLVAIDGAVLHLLCAAVLASSLLLGFSASAQSPQERRWCEGEDGASAAQRIEACSAAIKAGREKGEKLPEFFHNRGIAYRLKGDLEHAIQDYSQAIKLNGKFAAALINRGVAYDRKGDYDRAIQDFDQALAVQPLAEAHFNRGNAYLAKGHYDHAIDDFNQALKLNPDLAAAFDNRCWARAAVGILKQALSDCNQALRLTPNNAATFGSRGFVFLKMTQFDAAVSDFDTALRMDPKFAFALYGRGIAKLRNEDASGEADLASAKLLQSDIAQEYARYGIPDAH
jgi:tetratricopeptide (TPR) repeat protein